MQSGTHIGKYDHRKELKNPENDANDMPDVLENIDLIVTKKLNVACREMRYVIIDFKESFAGHGTQWEVCIKVKVILICYG